MGALLALGTVVLIGALAMVIFALLIFIYVEILLAVISSLILGGAATNYYQNTKLADSVVNIAGGLLGLLFGAAGGSWWAGFRYWICTVFYYD